MKLSKKLILPNKFEHPEQDEEHQHLDLHNSRYPETYAELSKYRTIFLAEDFSKEVSSSLGALLLYYNSENPNDPITIYIHSSGGDGSAFTHIYDVMKLVSAPIQTIAIGKCYSAAAILLAAGTKGERYCLKHSQIMIHGIQCVFPTPMDAKMDESKNYFQFLNDYNDNILRILAKNTGKSIKTIREDCKNDLYLNADEAKKYGLVDHVL